MEQESSFSRMERTLWSVWCFITETVNRILRPQPAETTSTDPTPLPESRPDSEPPDAEDSAIDSTGGGIDEEQPDSSVALLSSSASIVAWNVCSNDSKSDEEQLGGGNEDCKDTREEDCRQTGNDHAAMENGDEETGGELVKKVTLEDDDEKVGETTMEIQVMEDDGGEDSKEDGGEEEEHAGTDKGELQEEDAAAALMAEEVNISEGVLELSFKTKNDASPSACDEDEPIVATQEVRGDQIKDKGEEAAKQQAKEEEQNQEKNRITKDDQKDLTQCSEDAVQEIGQDTAEFTDKEEDVLVTVTQTTTQTDVSKAERILDKSVVDQVEEEQSSSEVHSKEDVSNSSEPEPEGETEPETSEEFKNIPLVEIEGQAPVSHRVNPKACEETREGVPELNNELGSDENRTQSVLEGGNYEEIHITQLPEEVESEERASLENSSTGDDYLLEEEQDLDEKELTGNLLFAQDTAVSLEFEEEEAELLDTSMKAELKPSDKDESGPDETNADLCDEAQAAESGINRDETSEILKTEMTEISRESMRSTDETFSLPEETTDCVVLEQIESKLSDDEGDQLTGFEAEEKESTDEEEEEIIPSGAKLIVSQKDKETPLIVESGLSLHPDTHVRRSQSPLEAPQTDMIEVQTEAESKTSEPNNLVMSEDETEHFPQPEEERKGEMSNSIGEHQDVIDEEILDLWLETATSKDSCTEEEQREDTMENKMKEKSGESSEEEEPAPVSDTETPSSTLDSGFLDQSFSEILPVIPESLEDIHDMLDSAAKSDDFSDFSAPNSESLIEDTGDTMKSFLREEESVSVTESRDSPEKKPLNEESESSEEKPLEMKAGVTETSLIEMKAQEETMSGSSEEIKLAELRQTETETLLEDRVVLTEPLSGGEHSVESEGNQLSVDASDHSWPLPGLGRAVVVEKRTSEDQDEVDAPGLNFTAQKSRITAKNPRTRRPSNPRALIQKPSEDPTLSSHGPVKGPLGMPLGRVGIGIKLPGFGGGIPVLKKKQKSIEVVDSQDTEAQEPEKKAEEGSESVKPKWKPPGHPGFGIPLMSELKTKLKKTPKE